MISIRSMQLTDLNEVARQEKIVFDPGFGYEDLKSELLINPYAYYFVMVDGEKIIGCVGLWITEPTGQITTLHVLRAYRGKSLGVRLLRHALNIMEDFRVTKITLEVRKSNLTAQNLYKKFDFEVVGERAKYYKTEDALLLLRNKEVIK